MSPGKMRRRAPFCPRGSSPTRRCHKGLAPLIPPARSPRSPVHPARAQRMKISCIGSPRVRGTISVFIFLLSFFVVIVHAPKGLSTLAAAARATSTGASSSADGASEAAYSAAALAAAGLAAVAAKVWTGTGAHTPVVPRHMHPSYTRESRAGSSTCTPRPLAATPQRALRQLHRLCLPLRPCLSL